MRSVLAPSARRNRRLAALLRLLPFGALSIGALSIGALSISLAQPAFAGPDGGVADEPLLGRVTVIAQRGAHDLMDVPQNVTILTGEEIDRRMVRDMQDLIRYQPGISVDRETSLNNPFGQLGSFTIRGVGGNRVQILVDGSRIQEQAIYGSRDFVDPFNMQLVEIVRGPNSVLWGADAVGGVVAFRTRDPQDLLGADRSWAGEAKTTYDSFDHSYRAQATAAFRQGNVALLLSGGYQGAQQPRLKKARADGGIWGCPRPDYFTCDTLFDADTDAWNALGKIVWTPDAAHEVRLTGQYFSRKTKVDQVWDAFAAMSGYQSVSYPREVEMRRFRVALEHGWQVGGPLLDEIRWQISYSPQKRDTSGTQTRRFAARTDSYSPTRNYGEKFLEADIQLRSSFGLGGSRHILTYGFDGDLAWSSYDGYNIVHRSDTGATTIQGNQGYNFPEVDTRRADIYMQDEISLLDDRLMITPALRLASYRIDPTGDKGYQPLPGNEPRVISKTKLLKKLGIVYKVDDRFSLYGSYGEGFKMPTSQQLFVSANDPFIGGIVLPNPDLKPESVKSYEAGVRGLFPNGHFSAGVFYADYSDFIRGPLALDPDNTHIWTYDNVEDVKLWGIEFAGDVEFQRNWWATVTGSYQRGNQRLSGQPRTPFDGAVPLTTTLGLRHHVAALNLDAEIMGTYGAKVKRRARPDAFLPDDYVVVDAYLNWTLWGGLEINAGVQNLFNTRYFPGSLYDFTIAPPSATTAGARPLELQTAPGRTVKLGATVRF